ncbi:MAG TPA: endo alpha-1,4 polygalactosaminidase, partial [Polyangiales bacterium]|nr:endo alpha-1,4 polygalactosaminidase [Polyangiales bacterium]
MTSAIEARAGLALRSVTFFALWIAAVGCASGLSSDQSLFGVGSGGAMAGQPAVPTGGVGAPGGPGSIPFGGANGAGRAGAFGGTSGTSGASATAAAGASGISSGALGGVGGNNASGASGGAGASTMAGASGSNGNSNGGPIWMPKPGVTWQWQLTGTLDTSLDVEMYDIDLFNSSKATIEMLQGAGRVVVCYFSAGTYEPDRQDSDELAQTPLGSVLDGWPDEKWLDIRSSEVRDVIAARLDVAASKGCDGVEPDNVDGYDNDNGLG